MPFDITNKVALISGAASGICLTIAKELLRNGLRGVTIADINKELGEKALQEIKNEFGSNKAIFVLTDVTSMKSFEEAFQKTVNTFKNLDILVNGAGILNESIWQQEIAINNGTVHGILLALENYILKHKTDSEGVIVNISSIAGVASFPAFPIYSGTKFAILGMTKAFGDEAHYKRTKIRVMAICPGPTDTPLLREISGRNLGEPYEKLLQELLSGIHGQKPESVAKGLVQIVRHASSGGAWCVEDDKEPYEFLWPERENFAPK
ncbi:15-hydroxyprostaglandin dehydrogenase [NAD(+)]-like isoform X2 [Tribolium madens]|uniref:15-hydroxyprostaglandin dehydrogenase [NAD(+)]-like isoform X2 n=1 Tax=Tribolium madens TaxID=41895 RepID=UPI001CF7583B|nr:15-hydroxyprostaglandin dehydrogenase [NAD(+)]-like isoform X2 [Tribolium madens]